MPVYISLLRGINVGGNKKIRMDALRALYEQLGLTDARTLLQSGNVIFKTEQADRQELKRRIEAGIEQNFGFHSEIILRSVDELKSVIARNPFSGKPGIEPGKLLVTFVDGTPDPDAVAKLLEGYDGPEQVVVSGDEVYIYYPEGAGRSKLDRVLNEKKLKMLGTGRNWNTVMKLRKLAESVEAG